MTTKRVRYSKIERLANDILSTACIEEPAVNVEALVQDRGIEVQAGELGEVSGLLARRRSRAIIGVNATQPLARQRFTMAHEFGHFLLHEGISSHADGSFRINYRDGRSSEASDVDEMEANFFAACLLMPKRFLDAERAFMHLDDDEGVRLIAGRFRVSQLAMSLRLSNVYKRHSPF